MIYAQLNGQLIAAWTIWERGGTQGLDWIPHVSTEQKLVEVASMQRMYTEEQSGPRCLKRPVTNKKKKKKKTYFVLPVWDTILILKKRASVSRAR